MAFELQSQTWATGVFERLRTYQIFSAEDADAAQAGAASDYEYRPPGQ